MQADIYIYLLIGFLGISIGSFLNVVIYRLPRNKSLVLSRSACPNCRMKISFFDNVPLLSYILLLGHCRHCRAPISARYPMVEMLNGLFYILFLYFDGMTMVMAGHCFLASSLLAIFFIDLEFYIIPDVISITGIVVGLGLAFFPGTIGLVDSLIGIAVGGGSLLLIAYLGEWLFKKEAMGGGDIKMAAMMGAFVGWQKVILIFMGGSIIGLIVSLIWMAYSKKIRSSRMIPFGPFLAMAAMITLVYGQTILDIYVSYIFDARAF